MACYVRELVANSTIHLEIELILTVVSIRASHDHVELSYQELL